MSRPSGVLWLDPLHGVLEDAPIPRLRLPQLFLSLPSHGDVCQQRRKMTRTVRRGQRRHQFAREFSPVPSAATKLALEFHAQFQRLAKCLYRRRRLPDASRKPGLAKVAWAVYWVMTVNPLET